MERVQNRGREMRDLGNDILHTTVRTHAQPHGNLGRDRERNTGIGVERQCPRQEPWRLVVRRHTTAPHAIVTSGPSSASPTRAASVATRTGAGRFRRAQG